MPAKNIMAMHLGDLRAQLLISKQSSGSRRRREGKNLNSVALERFYRIANISHLAIKIFENKWAAIKGCLIRAKHC